MTLKSSFLDIKKNWSDYGINKTAQTVMLKSLLNPSEYVFHCPRSKNSGLGDFKKAFTTVRKKSRTTTQRLSYTEAYCYYRGC